LSKEKKALLVQEISDLGFPVAAILGGLRELMGEDLKAIKLATIREAIKGKLEPEIEKAAASCGECISGFIIMTDPVTLNEFALACQCAAGYRHTWLRRWGGDNFQFSNGRELYRKTYTKSEVFK
jgi:hypothetical protein